MQAVKIYLILLLALLVSCIAPFLGIHDIPLIDFIYGTLNKTQQTILYEIRMPRVLLAFSVGAALSVSGVVFQALFKNNLASPFTLGVSAAAALGATLYFKFAAALIGLTFYGAAVFAFIFAFVSSLFILLFAHGVLAHNRHAVLLFGVALSFFCSSLVLFLQYTSNYNEMFNITRWLMGSLDVMGFNAGIFMFIVAAGGSTLILLYSKELDIISIDDDFAQTKGVNVRKANNFLLVTSSLMVAIVVSLCGVIGFVGIMVPHISRLLVSTQHFLLTIVSFLLGGVLLVLSDTLSRVVIAPNELPVGIITSLLGAPFFIGLLISKRT